MSSSKKNSKSRNASENTNSDDFICLTGSSESEKEKSSSNESEDDVLPKRSSLRIARNTPGVSPRSKRRNIVYDDNDDDNESDGLSIVKTKVSSKTRNKTDAYYPSSDSSLTSDIELKLSESSSGESASMKAQTSKSRTSSLGTKPRITPSRSSDLFNDKNKQNRQTKYSLPDKLSRENRLFVGDDTEKLSDNDIIVLSDENDNVSTSEDQIIISNVSAFFRTPEAQSSSINKINNSSLKKRLSEETSLVNQLDYMDESSTSSGETPEITHSDLQKAVSTMSEWSKPRFSVNILNRSMNSRSQSDYMIENKRSNLRKSCFPNCMPISSSAFTVGRANRSDLVYNDDSDEDIEIDDRTDEDFDLVKTTSKRGRPRSRKASRSDDFKLPQKQLRQRSTSSKRTLLDSDTQLDNEDISSRVLTRRRSRAFSVEKSLSKSNSYEPEKQLLQEEFTSSNLQIPSSNEASTSILTEVLSQASSVSINEPKLQLQTYVSIKRMDDDLFQFYNRKYLKNLQVQKAPEPAPLSSSQVIRYDRTIYSTNTDDSMSSISSTNDWTAGRKKRKSNLASKKIKKSPLKSNTSRDSSIASERSSLTSQSSYIRIRKRNSPRKIVTQPEQQPKPIQPQKSESVLSLKGIFNDDDQPTILSESSSSSREYTRKPEVFGTDINNNIVEESSNQSSKLITIEPKDALKETRLSLKRADEIYETNNYSDTLDDYPAIVKNKKFQDHEIVTLSSGPSASSSSSSLPDLGFRNILSKTLSGQKKSSNETICISSSKSGLSDSSQSVLSDVESIKSVRRNTIYSADSDSSTGLPEQNKTIESDEKSRTNELKKVSSMKKKENLLKKTLTNSLNNNHKGEIRRSRVLSPVSSDSASLPSPPRPSTSTEPPQPPKINRIETDDKSKPTKAPEPEEIKATAVTQQKKSILKPVDANLKKDINKKQVAVPNEKTQLEKKVPVTTGQTNQTSKGPTTSGQATNKAPTTTSVSESGNQLNKFKIPRLNQSPNQHLSTNSLNNNLLKKDNTKSKITNQTNNKNDDKSQSSTVTQKQDDPEPKKTISSLLPKAAKKRPKKSKNIDKKRLKKSIKPSILELPLRYRNSAPNSNSNLTTLPFYSKNKNLFNGSIQQNTTLSISELSQRRIEFHNLNGCQHPYLNTLFLFDSYVKRMHAGSSLDVSLLVDYAIKSRKKQKNNDPNNRELIYLDITELDSNNQIQLCKLMSRAAGYVNFFQLFDLNMYAPAITAPPPNRENMDEIDNGLSLLGRVSLFQGVKLGDSVGFRLTCCYRAVEIMRDHEGNRKGLRITFENTDRNIEYSEAEKTIEASIRSVLHDPKNVYSNLNRLFHKNYRYTTDPDSSSESDEEGSDSKTALEIAKERLNNDEVLFNELLLKNIVESSERELRKTEINAHVIENYSYANLNRGVEHVTEEMRFSAVLPNFIPDEQRGLMRNADKNRILRPHELQSKIREFKENNPNVNVDELFNCF